jgi:aspartate beta-hydroxylase/beta-hydroxylase
MVKLDYHIIKGAVNAVLRRYSGGRHRPVFLDIEQASPALHHVTSAYPVIRSEFESIFVQNLRVPNYQAIDPGEEEIASVDPHKSWKVFMLYLLGHKPGRNRAQCPQTCAALQRVPNVIQAFFSILEPGKSVPLHEGPYLGYLRYHLALRVPRQDPPRIVIHSQPYTWREGEAVLFDDSWPHEVINHSREIRAVLIVDVLRPLPWVPQLLNRFMTFLARHTYGRKVAARIEHESRWPEHSIQRPVANAA